MPTRVLILDDQQYLRDVISTILDDAGYVTHAVASTDEAWRQLDALSPGLLVLDLSLPAMSGVEFLERLRAAPQWKSLPVLIVSGDPAKLSQIGDRPHVVGLHKPFDVTVLVAGVARLLAARSPSA